MSIRLQRSGENHANYPLESIVFPVEFSKYGSMPAISELFYRILRDW